MHTGARKRFLKTAKEKHLKEQTHAHTHNISKTLPRLPDYSIVVASGRNVKLLTLQIRDDQWNLRNAVKTTIDREEEKTEDNDGF